MIEALGRFAEQLRREGVDVSPAELIDAAQALEAAGVEDRDRFRAALRTTLAKTVRQVAVFDRVFESFFAAPARAGGKRRRWSGGGAQGEAPRPAGRADVVARERGRRAREADREPDDVRRNLERAAEGGRRRGRLRRARLDDRQASDSPAGPAPRVDAARLPLDLPLPTEDERRVAQEVPRQIERLRLGKARRRRRARRGRIWLRRLYRESLAHGGVPFRLPFRRPRKRRPRVVLLVDVSYSVARAAGFFLWMAAEFVDLGRRARVLLFVDRPVDATERIRRWGRERSRGSAAAFDELLRSIPELNLSAPSDYGRALHRLLRSNLCPRGRSTVLLVLGDARTNRFDPLDWALEEISQRARAVVWLVPETRRRWGTGDSALLRYLPSIDTLVEARNLEGISLGLAELMRTL